MVCHQPPCDFVLQNMEVGARMVVPTSTTLLASIVPGDWNAVEKHLSSYNLQLLKAQARWPSVAYVFTPGSGSSALFDEQGEQGEEMAQAVLEPRGIWIGDSFGFEVRHLPCEHILEIYLN